MKFIYLIVFYCFVLSNISFSQETINADGGDANSGSGSISYSIGQMVYSSTENSSGSINEGIQQPFEIFTTGITVKAKTNFLFNIYPNPTKNSITLLTKKFGNESIFYRLWDNSGRSLLNDKISNEITVIEMSEFPSGNYILTVSSINQQLQTFHITKY